LLGNLPPTFLGTANPLSRRSILLDIHSNFFSPPAKSLAYPSTLFSLAAVELGLISPSLG
jgi:hypothetical protein